MEKNISNATIERLTLYCLFLRRYLKNSNYRNISSFELGRAVGASAAQVRKDLSHFGNFGCKGVGYEINGLNKELENIMGFKNHWPIALVGAGNLGMALVNYQNFKGFGLHIEEVFDSDLKKIGNNISDIKVKSINEMAQIIKDKEIEIGIIATPSEEAQLVANHMTDVGIRAIWNFAPVTLDLPENIILSSEFLLPGLASLAFRLNNMS